MVKQLRGMEEQKKAMEEGAKVFDETRTPIEKYAAEIEHLDDLLMRGALDNDTYNRAVERAQDELTKATKEPEAKKAGAVERRFDFFVPGMKEMADPQKDMAATGKKALTEAERQTGLLRTLVDKGGLEVVDF
jgi:hypothetical protein